MPTAYSSNQTRVIARLFHRLDLTPSAWDGQEIQPHLTAPAGSAPAPRWRTPASKAAGAQELSGKTGAQLAVSIQQPDAPRGAQGEIEIVGRDQHRAALPCQAREQMHHVHPAWEIEISRRLVEDQQLRLLGQGAGDHQPLALTVGQRTDVALAEVGGTHRFDRAIDRPPVLVTEPPRPAGARIASQGDQLRAREHARCHPLRQHDADPPRPLAGAQRLETVTFDLEPSTEWGLHASQGAQQSRLASAVGTEHGEHLTARHLESTRLPGRAGPGARRIRRPDRWRSGAVRSSSERRLQVPAAQDDAGDHRRAEERGHQR